MVVILESLDGDMLTPQGLALISTLTAGASELTHAARVDSVAQIPLRDDEPARAALLPHPLAAGRLVSADGRFAALNVGYDLPDSHEVKAGTLRELIERLDEAWPGLAFYLMDEQRALREHVAIWVDGQRLLDPDAIGDPIAEDAEVHLMQALSGG